MQGLQAFGTYFDVSSYGYDEQGKAAPGGFVDPAVHQKLRELNELMGEPPDDRWKSALFQIRRETGHVTFQFEYEDAARWKTTPLNLETMPEQLRPR